jgi:hypothetical protein
MASDIVERLRDRAVASDANDEMLFVAADEIAALRARVAELEAEKLALVERIVEAVKREGCGSCTAYGEWERCVRGAALGDDHA